MSSFHASENRFLTEPLGRLFLSNALPMTVIMTMNGLLTVIDAIFLGHAVGADALAAVSIVFPVVMVITALATLVGGGMSSVLARHLGAAQQDKAVAALAQAHGLALFLSVVLIASFIGLGRLTIDQLVGSQPPVATMAYTYLSILILAAPVQLLLSIHADALRNEGRAGLMAMLSVGVTLGNILLDYIFVIRLDLGVAGSAWGTALSQALGFAVLIALRAGVKNHLPLTTLWRAPWLGGWREIVILGAPVSLSFIGITLVSTVVLTALHLTAGAAYAQTVAAYGIVTRVFSFTFLPLMAIALATQSIVGNNFGAKLYHRSDKTLRLAVGVAFFYRLAIELVLFGEHHLIGGSFVSDPAVIVRVSNILRPMGAVYFLTGPILVLALYFQAIGQPMQTAALTLVKPFALTPLLVVALSMILGAQGIWFAFPVAEVIIALIAVSIVRNNRSRGVYGFGRKEETAR